MHEKINLKVAFKSLQQWIITFRYQIALFVVIQTALIMSANLPYVNIVSVWLQILPYIAAVISLAILFKVKLIVYLYLFFITALIAIPFAVMKMNSVSDVLGQIMFACLATYIVGTIYREMQRTRKLS